MTRVVSKKGASCLCQKTLEELNSFTWDNLHLKAPTLHRVLMGCVSVHRRERAGKGKGRRVRHPHGYAALGICAAILLRNRNQHLNLVQRLISLILHSGHAGKQVCFFKVNGV